MRFSLIRILPLTTEYNALVENPILDFEGEYFFISEKILPFRNSSSELQ